MYYKMIISDYILIGWATFKSAKKKKNATNTPMTTHFTLIQQVTTLIIDSVLLLQDQAIIQLVKYI